MCGIKVWNKSALVQHVRRYFYMYCVVCGIEVWIKSGLVQHVIRYFYLHCVCGLKVRIESVE